jgi:nucleoside-diphosphate-sugar epimerase
MRVFVAGAAAMIGRHCVGRYLIPALVADGHEVTGTTRSPGNAEKITALGGTPVIADGLDRRSVLTAVKAAEPAIRHVESAVTNELRTKGTDYLLEAAQRAGVKRFIQRQGQAGFQNG